MGGFKYTKRTSFKKIAIRIQEVLNERRKNGYEITARKEKERQLLDEQLRLFALAYEKKKGVPTKHVDDMLWEAANT